MRRGAFCDAASPECEARIVKSENVSEHAAIASKALENRVGQIRHHGPAGAVSDKLGQPCGFFTGKARSSMTSARLKSAALTPMPKASERIATMLNVGVFASVRAA